MGKYKSYFEEGLWDALTKDVKGLGKAAKQKKASSFFANPQFTKKSPKEIVHSALDKYDGDYRKAYNYLASAIQNETEEGSEERANVKTAIDALSTAVRKLHGVKLGQKKRGYWDDEDEDLVTEVDYKPGEFSRKTPQQIYNVAMERNRRRKQDAAEYLKDLLNYDIKKNTSEYMRAFEAYKMLIGKKSKSEDPRLPEKKPKIADTSQTSGTKGSGMESLPQYQKMSDANKKYFMNKVGELSNEKKSQLAKEIQANPNKSIMDSLHKILKTK